MGDNPTGDGSHSQRHEPAFGDQETIEHVEAHISRHVGKPTRVLHELVSDRVHIDVHVVEPTEAVPYYTLVTSGMSERPMNPPSEFSQWSYAEMVIRLPRDWPINRDAFKDEAHYFPVRLIRMLARLPHDYNTFLAPYHTIPNGDPPQPYAPNTKFCCAMTYTPMTLPQDFYTLTIDEARTIYFFGTFLLYKEEMDLKLEKGGEALRERLAAGGASEIVDVARPNVALK